VARLSPALAVRATGLVGAVALVALLPAWISHFDSFRLTFVGIYFIAIVGLNVVTGYSGQISLGHGAFMAIGAYTTAILSVNYGVGVYWTIPIAGVVAGLFGFAFGFPALRLSGVYLALATFGLAVAIVLIAKNYSFTGGGSGKGLEQPSSPINGLATHVWLYYLTWGIALVMLGVAWALLRGRLGRSLRMVRDAPIAAIAFGVSLAKFKTIAFGIAAFYAGIAGGLFAIRTAYVNPDTFPISLSILLLTGAVLGGLGSLEGMIFGALFIQFAPQYAEKINNSAPTVIYGLILLAVLFLMPEGAAGLLRQLRGLVRRRSERLRAQAAGATPPAGPSPSSSSSA
jgi:branched-chain amino acid transport system permease protein